MYDLLTRLSKHYLLKFIQLPVALWIDLQWANLRYLETRHLLRLDDYLLADMGLKRVGDRIEALDTSRIDPTRRLARNPAASRCRSTRVRHAD